MNEPVGNRAHCHTLNAEAAYGGVSHQGRENYGRETDATYIRLKFDHSRHSFNRGVKPIIISYYNTNRAELQVLFAKFRQCVRFFIKAIEFGAELV